MNLRLLGLFVPLTCLFGCEAVGPNEIATWNIFHENHAKAVYTTVAPDYAAAETLSARIDSQSIGTVVSPAQSLLAEAGAPTMTYGYAALDVSLDADFQKLLNPDPPTLKDYTELGPFPAHPIIDIAEISNALANADFQR